MRLDWNGGNENGLEGEWWVPWLANRVTLSQRCLCDIEITAMKTRYMRA